MPAGGFHDYSRRVPPPGAERDLLVAAAERALAEHGARRISVERIVRYAQLPESTFYDHFADLAEVLLPANQAFFERLSAEMAEACEGVEAWPLRVRASLVAILSYLAEAHGLARALMIEAAAISLAACQHQLAALDRFATLLSDGRRRYPRAAALPAPAERVLVGGIASLIAAHLLAEEPRALRGLEPDLVELALAPYLGESEARRVARAR